MFSGYYRMLLKAYKILRSLSNWRHTYLAEYLLVTTFRSFRKGIEKFWFDKNLEKDRKKVEVEKSIV